MTITIGQVPWLVRRCPPCGALAASPRPEEDEFFVLLSPGCPFFLPPWSRSCGCSACTLRSRGAPADFQLCLIARGLSLQPQKVTWAPGEAGQDQSSNPARKYHSPLPPAIFLFTGSLRYLTHGDHRPHLFLLLPDRWLSPCAINSHFAESCGAGAVNPSPSARA